MAAYAPKHPAGPETIVANCGNDGTEAFSAFHDESLLSLIEDKIVGTFAPSGDPPAEGPTNPPMEERGITMEELALHNSTVDCWVRYYEDIYELTYYAHPNPPGQSVIYMGCGKDGTPDFVSIHPRDVLKSVDKYKIGWVSGCLSGRRLLTFKTILTLLAGSIYIV
jgi:cytochrome b involved in lipid metabolism